MTTLAHADEEHRPPVAENSAPGPVASDTGSTNFAIDVEGERILRITLRPGSRITAADGTSVRERLLTLTGGAACAVLLQVTGVEHVSRDAVRVFSEAVTVRAFAILGSTSVDRVIAHGRRGLPLPQCPSRYFTDEQAALAWLRTANLSAGSCALLTQPHPVPIAAEGRDGYPGVGPAAGPCPAAANRA